MLVAVAFLAGSRVADTREGLIYEGIALLAGLAGVSLVLYGWVTGTARPRTGPSSPSAAVPPAAPIRSANELLIGGGGLVVAAVLVIGIAISAGMNVSAVPKSGCLRISPIGNSASAKGCSNPFNVR